MRKTVHRKFPQNSREIGEFFCKFVPESPAKFDFFSHHLLEALTNRLIVSCGLQGCH